MKKLLLVLAVAGFVACNNSGDSTTSADTTVVTPAPDTTVVVAPDTTVVKVDTTAADTLKK